MAVGVLASLLVLLVLKGYYLPIVISSRGEETPEEVVIQLTLQVGQI